MRIEAVDRHNYSGTRQSYIIHPYDGIKMPLEMKEFAAVMRRLLGCILRPFDYIISLDGPALIASTIAGMITEKPVVVATKADLDLPNKIKFTEPGSVNPVFLYSTAPGRVIIIDDEIRTGGTILSCIEAILPHRIEVIAAVVPIGSTMFSVDELFAKKEVPLLVEEWYDF